MEKKEDKKIAFEESLKAAFSAIAFEAAHPEQKKINVIFRKSSDANYPTKDLVFDHQSQSIIVTLPDGELRDVDVAYYRGLLDSEALKLRYHDKKIYQEYLPKFPSARKIYQAAEIARVEALGANEMKGVGQNIFTKSSIEWQKKDNNQDAQDQLLADIIHEVIKEKLTGVKAPEKAQIMIDSVGIWLLAKLQKEIDKFPELATDQKKFAKQVNNLIEALKFLQQGSKKQESKEQQNTSEDKKEEMKEEDLPEQDGQKEQIKSAALMKESEDNAEMKGQAITPGLKKTG